MACAKPLRGYTPAIGGRVRFYNKTDKEYWQEPYTGLTIPCGYCILCREEQARQTAIRIYHESKLWDANSFITLTYTDEQLPEHNSLHYPHLVKFWKRLRKHIGELRYYAVGEYGDRTKRPHYHACIFGHDFRTDAYLVRETPHLLWESPTLNQIWGHGRVTIGALTFQTARYTASYVTKKLRSRQRYVRVDPHTGELIAVTQPRAFMSRNIGKDWWITWGHQLKDHDQVIIDGKPQKPPRAYDRWLGEVDETKLQEIKTRRQQLAKPITNQEAHARAQNAHARAKSKIRSV